MVNFMRDPTGDIPWEEDPTAGDVVHVDNKQVSIVLCIVKEVTINLTNRHQIENFR